MVVRVSTIGNDNDDGLGENRRLEGGRGRTEKDSDVEDVDMEADGEVLAISPPPPLDRDGVVDKDNVRGICGCPCASTQLRRRTLKNKTNFPGWNRSKIELIIK